MKPLINISSTAAFVLLLGFLLLVNFSIAGCYILFTLLSLLLVATWIKERKHLGNLPPLPGYFKYFILYGLCTMVSVLFSIDRLASFKDSRQLFVFLLVPLFIYILHRRERLELSLGAVFISSAVSALVGIGITLAKGVSLDHRLQGLTSHWMTYSGLLMFSFIFFFAYFFYEKNKTRKLIIAAGLLPILAAILLSLTRSVWVGIFFGVGLFIVYYKPKILYLAVPAALVLAFLLPHSIKSRLMSTFDLQNETNRDRIYMMKTGINILKEYPFTGVGPDNVAKVYDRYKPPEAQLSNPHLHNNFVQMMAERGLLGLLSLLAAFIAVLVYLIRKLKHSGGMEKAVAAGSLFAFIGFLVAGLFEYNFGDTEIKFFLLYFLSIPFLQFKKEEAQTGKNLETPAS